jgi:hypothetical protein
MAKQFNITTKTKDFEQMTQNRLFSIPLYQRRYNWDETQIDTFYSDVINTDIDSNFFGIVILTKSKSIKGRFEIIDGQQRMTTFYLFIKAIELATVQNFKEKNKKQVEEFQRIIRDILYRELETTLLTSEKDQTIFKTILELKSFDSSVILDNKSKQANAVYFFYTKLIEVKSLAILKKYFENATKKQHFIEVLTEGVANVYEFFKSLNAKGLELALEDLVKNELYNGLKRKKAKETEIVHTLKIWESLVDSVKKIPKLSVEKYLFYYLNSRQDIKTIKQKIPGFKGKPDYFPLPQKHIFKAFEVLIHSVSSPNELVTDLNAKFIYVKEILNPKPDLKNEMYYSYSLLNAFSVTKGVSSLIAAKSKIKNAKQYLQILQGIELTCIRHIFSGTDQKALEEVFSRVISKIHSEKPNITEIKKELLNSSAWNNNLIITRGFENKNSFSNIMSKHLLLRMNISDFIRQAKNWSYQQIQLEHVMPQKPIENGKFHKLLLKDDKNYEYYCNSIGNHILISTILNNSISNSDLDVKQSYYKLNTFKSSKFIENAKKWDFITIKSRQTNLAKEFSALKF